jgi:hypothetical protein
LKVLINIATNEGSSRNLIAKSTELGIKESLLMNLDLGDKFLLARLLFLLSIDFDGAKLFTQSAEIENFIKEAFENLEAIDDSEKGKIIIDILRFRYNQVRNGLIDHKK